MGNILGPATLSMLSAELVSYAHGLPMQSSRFARTEVHVPESFFDFFQPDVLTFAGLRYVNPSMVPKNVAVGADVAKFEVIGTLKERDVALHRA